MTLARRACLKLISGVALYGYKTTPSSQSLVEFANSIHLFYVTRHRLQQVHGNSYGFKWRLVTRLLVLPHQETAAQIAALKTAGCELIFQETASGGRWDRPELHRLLGQLRQGDVLVVWKLDRLSRSLKDVLSLMEKIAQAQAGFRSLTEAITHESEI